MSEPVTWLPIPGTEGKNLPVSMGATWNGLVIMTQLGQKPDGSLELGDIRSQARQTLANLRDELERAGSGIDRVLHVNVYLTDAADMAGFAEEWAELYPGPGPGRRTVVVGLAPAGLRVELTAFAALR